MLLGVLRPQPRRTRIDRAVVCEWVAQEALRRRLGNNIGRFVCDSEGSESSRDRGGGSPSSGRGAGYPGRAGPGRDMIAGQAAGSNPGMVHYASARSIIRGSG